MIDHTSMTKAEGTGWGPATPACRDVVVIGGSAGAIESLKVLIGSFPPDLAAAVLVVIYLSPNASSKLPDILPRGSALPVGHPFNGEGAEAHRAFLAPPDPH